jgi:GalNAc-alpha-(1->4)-GalNAc-alpha-(1->3)-diNAcBac-PP-undecaprenol alpha-1,4-N-acetyl-D-galactosaminyltransferase
VAKKKILIINNGLAGGGIERASVSLANYFVTLGFNVSIIALYKSNPFFRLHQEIKFVEPDFERTANNKIGYTFKMMFFLRKYVKNYQPDTILAFSEWTNPYVVLALSGLQYPLYLTDRMNPLAKLPFLSELLRKYLYGKANGLIAQSNFAKAVLLQKTKSRNIAVINNPVNIIERIDTPTLNRIVTVGRVEKVKGHEYLIKAFAQIKDNSWELSIVGDGSERTNLENLAKELKVDNRVIFHGHLIDFRKQLSEAQIFVLPSLKEGFPNALIEAMTVPLACVASDTFHGYNEIINSGVNGILVTPGNPSELTEAINRLIEDKNLIELLMTNAIKVRVDLKFETIAQNYLDVILPSQ